MKSSHQFSKVPSVAFVALAATLMALTVWGCAPQPDTPASPEGDRGGGTAYGFPFPTRTGHTITATPDDHRGLTTQRNWDLDCTLGQPVGSVISGAVTVVRDGLPRGTAYGYGNRVCVRNPDSGVEVCHNHLAASSLPARIAVGCWVRQGDRIGACGNSGYTIALPGGDGSHVDVYAVDRTGANVELSSPTAWAPLASLAEATSCARPSLEVVSPRGGERLVRGVTGSVRWRSTAVRGGIQVDVYRGGEFFAQLAASDPDDGEIPFEPPRSWALGDYTICVSAERGTVWTCAPGSFALVDADGGGDAAGAFDAGLVSPPALPGDAGSPPALPGSPDVGSPTPAPDVSTTPPPSDAGAPPPLPAPTMDAGPALPPPPPSLDAGPPPPPSADVPAVSTPPVVDAAPALPPPADVVAAPVDSVRVDAGVDDRAPMPPPSPDAGVPLPPMPVVDAATSPPMVDVPASPREVCDGADNDGDGLVDEDFLCRLNARGAWCRTACGSVGYLACERSGDVCVWGSSCRALPESEGSGCSDTVDNDCNGATDCADPACGGAAACLRRCGDGRCDPGEDCSGCSDCTCAAGQTCAAGACVPCGRRDAPCCGASCEEGLRCEAARCACPDGDGDGARDARCGGTDCDDRQARVAPGRAEICDGIDDDCDGAVDDGADTSCATPPAAYCADANTAMTYNAAGACRGGTCAYAATPSTCAFGCSAGRCNATGPGAWGDDVLVNGDFRDPVDIFTPGGGDGWRGWTAWSETSADYGACARVAAGGWDGAAFVSCAVRDPGVPVNEWSFSLLQNVPLRRDARYRLTFWARADRARRLAVDVESQSGGTLYGLNGDLALGTSWRLYTLDFTASGFAFSTVTAKLMFKLTADGPGRVDLDDVELRPGA